MSDSGSIRSAGSRASAFLNRPHIAPLGPRTRQSSRISTIILDNALKPTPISPNFDVHECDEDDDSLAERVPSTSTSPTSSKRLSSRSSLPPVHEEPTPAFTPSSPLSPLSPGVAPAYDDENELESRVDVKDADRLDDDAGLAHDTDSEEGRQDVQGEEEQDLYMTEPSSLNPTPQPTPKLVAPAALPRLSPPESIKFDTTTIPWKGLPLDVALCRTPAALLPQSSLLTIFRDY